MDKDSKKEIDEDFKTHTEPYHKLYKKPNEMSNFVVGFILKDQENPYRDFLEQTLFGTDFGNNIQAVNDDGTEAEDITLWDKVLMVTNNPESRMFIYVVWDRGLPISSGIVSYLTDDERRQYKASGIVNGSDKVPSFRTASVSFIEKYQNTHQSIQIDVDRQLMNFGQRIGMIPIPTNQ